MAIVKEPKPLPSPLDYVPANSVEYSVTSNDSWDALAQRQEMRSAGISANDLCYFNFKSRHAAEINWYLYHKVGCRHTTKDGVNYVFSLADSPGTIYLPKVPVALPAHEKKEEPPLNSWLGIVGKAGTMFAVVGIETVAGAVVSLDDPSEWMAITASVNRVGAGWGATFGFAFVFVTGVTSPEKLNGWQQGDSDFNLALGENWGKLASSASKLDKIQPIIQAMTRLGAKTPGALKKLLKAKPDKYVELVKAVKSVRDFGKLNRDGDPEVFMWDVPWGSGGAEVSAFWGLSNFNAVWDGTN